MGMWSDNSTRTRPAVRFLSLPQMRYPNEYVWFVFFSSLDIMLTWAILSRNGEEVNPVAARVIAMWGLPGAIIFKFSLTLLVILICEIAGRDRDRLGRTIARLAITISCLPVIYSLGLLTMHTMEGLD